MSANLQTKQTTLKFLAKIWGNYSITCDILVLITLRVLQRAGWRWIELDGGGWSRVVMDGAGWSWVEVDGGGWSWVHSLVIPDSNTREEQTKKDGD